MVSGSTADQLSAVFVGIAVTGAGTCHRRCSTSPDRHRNGSCPGAGSVRSVRRCHRHAPASSRPHDSRAGVTGTFAAATAPVAAPDRIQDRRRRGDQRMLARGPSRHNGPWASGASTMIGPDRGNIAHGRDQIVMQVLGHARNILFHQCHAQPLRHPAVDLALPQASG